MAWPVLYISSEFLKIVFCCFSCFREFEVKGIFLEDEVMIDKVGSKHRPKSILFLRIEFVPEVGIEFLFSREEVINIISIVVLINIHSLHILSLFKLCLRKAV